VAPEISAHRSLLDPEERGGIRLGNLSGPSAGKNFLSVGLANHRQLKIEPNDTCVDLGPLCKQRISFCDEFGRGEHPKS